MFNFSKNLSCKSKSKFVYTCRGTDKTFQPPGKICRAVCHAAGEDKNNNNILQSAGVGQLVLSLRAKTQGEKLVDSRFKYLNTWRKAFENINILVVNDLKENVHASVFCPIQ